MAAPQVSQEQVNSKASNGIFLKHDGLTLTELCEKHDMSRQAVTKHLALLEAANLVASRKRGREKLHYLNPVPINDICMRWIGKFEQERMQALHNLKQALEGETDD